MEKLFVIEARSGRLWPEMARAVQNARAKGRKVLLYVPEQMTLQTERNLILSLRLKGLMDVEVISPRKLRQLVQEKTGGTALRSLDERGQLMAVQRAMTDSAEDLGFYRNTAELPGAVRRVREALAELRESEITGEEMEKYAEEASTGAVRARILDLKRILSAYEDLVSAQFEDEKTAWSEMVRRLKGTDLLQNTELMVYGFDTVRPDLRELLLAAAEKAECTRVFLTAGNTGDPDEAIFEEQARSVRKLLAGGPEKTIKVFFMDAPRKGWGGMMNWLDRYLFADYQPPYPEKPGDEIALYAAADPEDEAEHIADCLLKWHEQGIPWERMAVVLPGNSSLNGLLRACLALSDIPFSGKEQISAVSHGVCRMLTGALECMTEGYSTEHVAEIAESGFCTLTQDEAALLLDYAQERGIEGALWEEPFRRGENAAEAEAARRKLTDPIEQLRTALKEARSAAASVEAIVAFLEAEKVWDRLKEREAMLTEADMYREAVMDRQVWKLLMDVLDQLWALLGERRATLREMKNLLDSALESSTVTTLPETENGVFLGEVGHMPETELDALVLSGCQEGLMTVPESGWLTDREREEMEKGTGREVGISRERRGWIRKYDYYRVMTMPEKYLRVSWSLRDEGGSPLQEDGLITRIRTAFPGIRQEGSLLGGGEVRPRTAMMALESIGGRLEENRKGSEEDGTETQQEVFSLLRQGVFGPTARKIVAEAAGETETPALNPETARKLFHADPVSISRLERYAACPYQHFVDYGLRPVQPKTYEFSDADAGNFFHSALDRFLKSVGQEPDWPRWTDAQVDGRMDAICAELTEEWEGGPLREDALGIWQGEDCLRRVHHAARVLTRFAANSEFRTLATEQSFGRGEGMPALPIRLPDGTRASVHGIIDRMDTYTDSEGTWLRVVDNKSREKKPDPARMADGEQLQLMIYLKAALEAMPEARPAGALFFPVQDAEVGGEDESPEALEAERLKKVRMKGLVNAREDVARAMDRDLRPYSVDEMFNKDGSVKKNAGWAVEEEVLQGLMAAAERKAGEICGEIRSGRIAPAPRGTADDNVCRYCGYRTLCHMRKEFLVPREENATYGDIARGTAEKTAEKPSEEPSENDSGKNTLREEKK